MTIARSEAAERLARKVESVDPDQLAEVYGELFPDEPVSAAPNAREVARLIRDSLAAEELVDLWNVLFPRDRNVWYDEELDRICVNEPLVESAD